jgi:cysteine/O-acetylserine efflux protein
MLASALLSQSIRTVLPRAEGYLRIAGALYILWLAYHSLKSSYQFDSEGMEAKGFRAGILLQALNPKALVYGLTMYSSFLLPLAGKPFELVLSAIFFAMLTFVAVSVWSLTGAAIRRYMRNETVQRLVNTILALLLVYTAYEISGL